MRRLLILGLVISGCGSPAPARTPQQRGEDSAPAITALRASKFDDASREATAALGRDPRNSQAAAVRALATYQTAAHDLFGSLVEIEHDANLVKAFDHERGRAAWQTFVDRLSAVDADLAVVAADPQFSLELCIACWETDFNHDGKVDDRDRHLLELELDAKGERMEPGDPRRRPTFRFDVGDADWARAMVAFQRAFGELVLAYRWGALDSLFKGGPTKLRIELADAGRVHRARELILAGLGYADRCREEYLAETDDDREWVPNPRQNSHPIPLEVDQNLYATWAGVTGDLRKLIAGKEGISLKEAMRMFDRKAERLVPDAYLDLGAMLSEPKDIVLDLGEVDLFREPSQAQVERILRNLVGNGYKKSMRASPLVGRLRAMKEQLDRGEDTFERKLRYLFWLN